MMNQGVLSELRRSLTRTRQLEARAATRIRDRLRVDQPLDGLVTQRIARLEPYEVELLLASLFTPDNSDREPFEAVLPLEGVGTATLAGMVKTLAQENIECPVEFAGDACRLVVPEIIIERYVRLLHLDQPIQKAVAERVNTLFSAPHRQHALCCVRQPVWQGEERMALLLELLEMMQASLADGVEKLVFLSDFVESYRPLDLAQLTWQLIHLVESYQDTEIGPVFNPELENLQVNALGSRYSGHQVKGQRLAMAHSLLKDLKVIMKSIDM
ncbi:MAG: hypothetical protein HQL64_02675 [Magnetococcales bacterium]|nr:hypothetical protein [Magnetococcales bacterium]